MIINILQNRVRISIVVFHFILSVIPGQFSGVPGVPECSRVFSFRGLRTCLVIKPYIILTFQVCFGLFRAQHTITFKTSSD